LSTRKILFAVAFGCVFDASARAGTLVATVRDAANRPLSSAVVVATPVGGAPLRPTSTARASMDQRNQKFVPSVLPVQVGTRVSFPNSDNVRHQVYSFSSAKMFELPLYSGTPTTPITFDKPGVATLGCSIHDAMIASVYVTESPWFSTSQNGTARIEKLPAGEYDVHVWHPTARADSPKQRVVIKDGTATSELSFRLAPAAAVPPPTPPSPAPNALKQKFKKFGNGR